jgi:hypothetical protein
MGILITLMRSTLREYRRALVILREHEGWRAVRWPAAALGLRAAVWGLALAGGIASYYLLAKAGNSLLIVALSAAVTLALGGSAAAWSQRRPWWTLLANRADGYEEQTDPYAYALGIVQLPDRDLALHALRRAGLQARCASVPGPADAPQLNCRMEIYRPRNCTKPGLEPVNDQALRVLAELGVEGRVSGRDVRTGLDIWSGSAAPACAPQLVG